MKERQKLALATPEQPEGEGVECVVWEPPPKRVGQHGKNRERLVQWPPSVCEEQGGLTVCGLAGQEVDRCVPDREAIQRACSVHRDSDI